MNNRGVSVVIGTIFMVALVLVAASITWVLIRNVVNQSGDEVSLGRVSVDLKILSVSINAGNLVVNVQREKGKGELKGIKFVVEGNDEIEVVENDTSLEEFEATKFSLVLETIAPENVTKVSVVPVLKAGTSDVKDIWEKPSSGINCVSVQCPDPSTICSGVIVTDGCGTNCPVGTKGAACINDFASVPCGQSMLSHSGCGTCPGKGTKCDDPSKECFNDVCVEKLRIFVTSRTFSGSLGGTVGADVKCNDTVNGKPAGGTGIWKAMIGATNRYVGGTDWILNASRNYYQKDGQTLIDTAGNDAWFTWNLNRLFNSDTLSVWTGLTSSGKIYLNCNNFSSSLSTLYGTVGNTYYVDSRSIFSANWDCSRQNNLYCVEQPSY